MDLREIDLNLLVVFDRLMTERRVSRAADSLGVSQPAVSNSLAKLRRLLGDELFLRTSKGMQPTPYAEQLAAPVSAALGALHGALNQRQRFEPARSEQAFTIGVNDIGEIYFLPRLMERVAAEAPAVRLSTVRSATINLRDEMEAGKVHLAIGLLPQLKAGFFQRRLFKQRYVLLFRRGHALDKKRVTVREFSNAQHLHVVSIDTGHAKVDSLIERSGIRRDIRLTVPHFVAVGHILTSTDLVATVPQSLAERVAGPFGLNFVAHPVELPEFSINLFWHARLHRDPAAQWLRSVVVAQFGGPSP